MFILPSAVIKLKKPTAKTVGFTLFVIFENWVRVYEKFFLTWLPCLDFRRKLCVKEFKFFLIVKRFYNGTFMVTINIFYSSVVGCCLQTNNIVIFIHCFSSWKLLTQHGRFVWDIFANLPFTLLSQVCYFYSNNYLLKINFIKFKAKLHSVTLPLVRVTGLEPAHLTAQEPKSCVSANFTTPAY